MNYNKSVSNRSTAVHGDQHKPHKSGPGKVGQVKLKRLAESEGHLCLCACGRAVQLQVVLYYRK